MWRIVLITELTAPVWVKYDNILFAASPILCRSITETYLEINTVNSLGYFIVVS